MATKHHKTCNNGELLKTDRCVNQKRGRRLETRRNFFSNRVVEAWNMVPGDTKRAKTVSGFKNAYKNHREAMVENAQDG
jgi:hypothetical protein